MPGGTQAVIMLFLKKKNKETKKPHNTQILKSSIFLNVWLQILFFKVN